MKQKFCSTVGAQCTIDALNIKHSSRQKYTKTVDINFSNFKKGSVCKRIKTN